MERQTEQEIYKFMGRTADAIENINKRLDALPCKEQAIVQNDMENRIIKLEEKSTMNSALFGVLGSILFAFGTWLLGKIKL